MPPVVPEVAAPEVAAPALPEGAEVLVSKMNLLIYRSPSYEKHRGMLLRNEAFVVLERLSAKSCPEGWARLGEEAWVCLRSATATTATPILLPRLVPFDPPDPVEWTQYSSGKGYSHDPVDVSEAILPFIYGKPWRHWDGALYKSVSSYANGAASIGNLEPSHKYHFEKAVDTKRGTVLVRADGQVSPLDDVFLYPISRFHGRDLSTDPVPEGFVAGWTVSYEGAPLYAQPDAKSEVLRKLDLQTQVIVKATPVSEDGRWWEITDATGTGYMREDAELPTFRRWNPAPPPPELGPEAVWVDVNIPQQTLALMKGDVPQFITLVSTGLSLATPIGLFRISDKSGYLNMQGRVDTDAYQPYFVENVPWVMHFAPRYALHGAFWHWGFGHPASHGCVNLSPMDARWVYEHVGPTAKEGWLQSIESPADPGTPVRIRGQIVPVRDRRVPLN